MRNKLFLFIVIYFLKLTVYAQLISQLHLKLYDNTPFTITIDQENYVSPANNFILNLLPGKHYLQVVRTTVPANTTNRPINSLTFSGIITIPYNVSMFAHIDPENAFNVINILPFNNSGIQDRSLTYPSQPLAALPGWDKGIFNLLKEESFSRLKLILQKTNSSKMKLDIIKQAVTFKQIKSEQVAELMLLLDFDTERLELAKYAYYFTVDKENYFLINDSFIFSGSIKEINKHIYTY